MLLIGKLGFFANLSYHLCYNLHIHEIGYDCMPSDQMLISVKMKFLEKMYFYIFLSFVAEYSLFSLKFFLVI